LGFGGHGESGKIKVESGKLWNPDVVGMDVLIVGVWAVDGDDDFTLLI